MQRKLVTTAVGALLLCAAAASSAEEAPPPFPEFTFKRVGVPKPGSGPRITVQIQEETAEAEAAKPSETPAAAQQAPVSQTFAWFWETVSPTIDASGPGRLDSALAHIASEGGVTTPRLDLIRSVAVKHNADILLATVGTKVSPALVLSVIAIESAGRADAVSHAGATGLMQLMPDTAARFNVADPLIAAQNIKGGVAYLDWLMGEFDGDPILVLAAYNAGEGTIKRYEGVPPYAETRAYVPKVLAAWTVARGLCKTPPELVSDGCAFELQGS